RELLGRLRLGDSPQAAVRDLAFRVPLETLRLFSLSLQVHWETGGSLAATLTTVARTIRDRIEMSRRIRSQAVEAHASVVAVVGIAYGIGWIMYRANPEPMREFLLGAI